MNTIFATELVTDRDSRSDGTESISSLHTTDFFEARHQPMVARQETATPQPKNQAVQDTWLRYEDFTAQANVFEQTFYWFFSGPALAYLAYLFLGL